MFGGSSQLTTTAEHSFVVWTVLNDRFDYRARQLSEAGRSRRTIDHFRNITIQLDSEA